MIAITSSLIVFCTLYVSSTSSCYNFDPDTTLAQVQANTQLTYCYCNEHFT